MNYAVVELLQYVPEYMGLIQGNEIEIVYQLLGHGMVSPNKFLSDDFISPLALACEKGHLQMVKLLWMFGASIEAGVETHIPPLHAAIRGQQIEVVRWLLKQEVDVLSRNDGCYWVGKWGHAIDAVILASYLDDEETYELIVRELNLNRIS